jgi:hypothetical protein
MERMIEMIALFFHIADLIQAKIIWSSNRLTMMKAVPPDEFLYILYPLHI